MFLILFAVPSSPVSTTKEPASITVQEVEENYGKAEKEADRSEDKNHNVAMAPVLLQKMQISACRLRIIIL